jgi:signal transduction histidine kinase/CheY-like chemotaxis protein
MLSQRLVAVKCINNTCPVVIETLIASTVQVLMDNSAYNNGLGVVTSKLISDYRDQSMSVCDLFSESLLYVDNVDTAISVATNKFTKSYDGNFRNIVIFFTVSAFLSFVSIVASIRLMLSQTQQYVQKEKQIMQYLFHEIRNPLNQIMYSIETLSADNLTESKNACEAAGTFILDVLNNVLLMASLENQRRSNINETFCMPDIIKQCCNIFSNRKAIQYTLINTNSQQHNDWWYNGCYKAIKQIIVNLLSNAVAHSGAESTVDIQCELLSTNGDQHLLKISVVDDGPGLSETIKSMLFQKFSAVNRRSGTGLGLYLCQCLVHNLGGTLTVESPYRFENKGTCFSFTVILTSVSKPVIETKSVQETDMKSLSLLICDDETFNLKILRHTLVHTGLKFDTIQQCDTLEECLVLCSATKFDLIFLDEFFKHSFPVTGSQYIEKLRKNGVVAPIIIASANTSDEDQMVFTKRGAIANITKPYPIAKDMKILVQDIVNGRFKNSTKL